MLVLARGLPPVLVGDKQGFDLRWLDAKKLRERGGPHLQEIAHLRAPPYKPRRVNDGERAAFQALVAREGTEGALLAPLYGATFDSSQGAFTPPAVYTLTART